MTAPGAEAQRLGDVIVVGVALRDADIAPLRLARELARVTGARLALVHAYPYDQLIAVAPPDWEREMRAKALAALEELAAPLRDSTEVIVRAKANPSAVRALHEAAEELGASLLVAGGSHRGPVSRVAPGGVATRLLHAAPCAVAIAPLDRPVEQDGLRRIGIAFVDGPEGADALAIGAGLAARAGGVVRTFTVIEPGTPSPGVDERRRARVEGILAKVKAAVPAELLKGSEVLEGEAAGELARVSAELDLLICGSRGYGPVRSLLLGGVTWRLAHATACPLLVVPRAPVPGFRILTGGPVPSA